MNFHILTLFPGMFRGPFEESIVGKVIERGIVSVSLYNLRDFTNDPHRTVDDYSFGGGAGMVLKAEPVLRGIRTIAGSLDSHRLISLTPQGTKFDQEAAKVLSREREIVIFCGHYSGVDERIHEVFPFEEFSIGDYILTGGEIGAMAMVDAIVRMIPGSLGNFSSAKEDSFYTGLLGYPLYTRPERLEGLAVPGVLLTGDHGKVRRWRQERSLSRTLRRRPDLFERKRLTAEELGILRELLKREEAFRKGNEE